MELALRQAEKSIKQGGFPAGAIIVRDGKVIAEGIGIGFKLNDPTSHPETTSIRQACKNLGTVNLEGASLYSSLQPCMMCFSAAGWAKISQIVYAAKKTEDMVNKEYYEGNTDLDTVNQQNRHKIELIHLPEYESRSLALVKEWEKKRV